MQFLNTSSLWEIDDDMHYECIYYYAWLVLYNIINSENLYKSKKHTEFKIKIYS